jgi:hypothetical protein
MFDPIAFLAVMIESKAVLDVPDMLAILINVIGQALAPMLPLVPGAQIVAPSSNHPGADSLNSLPLLFQVFSSRKPGPVFRKFEPGLPIR